MLQQNIFVKSSCCQTPHILESVVLVCRYYPITNKVSYDFICDFSLSIANNIHYELINKL